MSWEGAVFIFARWPWSLLGLAAGAYAVVVRRGLDFRVTPKGSDAASAAPVGVVIPYIGLSVVSALPAALTADPGTAAGFYAFALLNALGRGTGRLAATTGGAARSELNRGRPGGRASFDPDYLFKRPGLI